jgi:hypothetical protein
VGLGIPEDTHVATDPDSGDTVNQDTYMEGIPMEQVFQLAQDTMTLTLVGYGEPITYKFDSGDMLRR